MSNIQNADILTNLPSDQTQPSHNELRIVNTLFKEHKQGMDAIFEEAKIPLLVGLLFALFSVPQVDEMIAKFFPSSTNSYYILILIKSIGIAVVFWVVRYLYLAKK